MMIYINILLLILFIYMALSVMYVLVFSLAGRFGKVKNISPTGIYRKFAVLIPSYKEDEVILESARQAMKQTYPKDKFDIMVIADSLKSETVEKLRSLPVSVLEVSFDVSTKAKSINKALEVLPVGYDYVLILDADNIMAEDFIEKMNEVFVKTGAAVVQGHRVAKNLNTNFAILDAVSEEVNNHIFRKGHRVLGLSSALIGSGMAFEYECFKDVMATNTAVGGFDRELELKLLKDGVVMEYASEAYVYDEKVENAEVFQNQRRRWLSAQLHYFRKYFFQGVWHLITRRNIDFFDKVFQQFLLPRVLLLASLMLFVVASVIVEFGFMIYLAPGSKMWMVLLLSYLAAMVLAVPDFYFNKRTLNAAMSIPKAMMLMFLTLFKLKGANKKFIHTPHSGRMDRNMDTKS